MVVFAGAAGAERKCAVCGEPITGAVFETNGVYYHPEHFRCAYCDRPITEKYTSYHGKNYHVDCFRRNIAARCALCGGVIEGEYFEDFWGNAYHLKHKDKAPCCDSCGRFISDSITGGGVRYDDGRYICAICHPESVEDINDILDIIHEVAEHMTDFDMDVDYRGVEVHLIGRDQMKEIAGQHSNSLRGFTDYSEKWRLFGKPQNRKVNVYLLYGMPRMELISTVAHELAHVWQFNQGRFDQDPEFAEGSCNYAAYLVLGMYPGQLSSFFRNTMMKSEDPVYGEGFRRVKRYAEAVGADDWLWRVKQSRRLPRGY